MQKVHFTQEILSFSQQYCCDVAYRV
jgi:hypothetical protein